MRGKIVTAFIFLTMMTGAVSAAPVLDYKEQSGWKKRGREKKSGRKGCAYPV